MNFLGLSRSVSVFSPRIIAPSLSRFTRSKSTSTRSILFSPSPRKLEVAVTPKRVTLKFAENPNTEVATKVPKTAPATNGLKANIEAKIKKGLSSMGLTRTAAKPVATKSTGHAKIPKATATTKEANASKSNKKGTPSKNTTFKPLEYVPCWVDASPTHIAIVIGDHYKVFALNNGWMSKSRDINWAETAAFELLAQVLAQQGRSGVVYVNSDSATALRAMSGERVKVPEIVESARRTGDILKSSMFTIKGVKISRTTNLADRFTRGKTLDGYKEMKGDITVPEALVPFVTAL